MSLSNRIFTSIAIIVSFLSLETNAQTISYGDLYIVEEKLETKPWRISASYGLDLSNSYQNIQEFQGQVDYKIKNYLLIGTRASIYKSKLTNLASELEYKINKKGYRQYIAKPQNSYFATISLLPLSGRLNWFQSKTGIFYLWTVLGYGTTNYKSLESKETLLWEVRLEGEINKDWGAFAGLGQDIEDAFQGNELYKTQLRLGIVWRL